MEKNIIDAIITLVEKPVIKLKDYAKSNNRANNMGDSLEEYVKDLFAGTVFQKDLQKRNKIISECFSYLGNKNNPPDSILKNGDAIEVKKIESKNSSLALNSSYPKNKLFSDSPMITEECKKCENWTEKDIIYAIGVCKNSNLSSLIFVYGEDYAASKNIYERIKEKIKTGISSIEDVEFAETNELGRVNRVDPLGITYLRIRGMWGIENPNKVFNYIYEENNNSKFNFMALVNNEKYYSFQNFKKLEELEMKNSNLRIKNVEINDPNNPAKLKKAKLITFNYSGEIL